MGAPAEVKALVEKYRRDADYFRSAAFKEMSIRSEFLNPVLKALGWNPDNAFVFERKRMFFLEAKRPSVRISTDRAPAYQIRRYCWNAGLPMGLVTDFEEWAVYDCRSEPNPNDPSTIGRIEYFGFEQLDEKWDYLEGLFGRAAVASGSLSKYSADRPLPRGTLTVDQAFLKEINAWRNYLAVDLVGLNGAVQNLIDRIIFLRIAEARGLEEFGELKSCADGKSPSVYSRLMSLFKRADDRYNSGLFHFTRSGDQQGDPDLVAPTLSVSDRVLRYVIRRLYYPYPYESSVMPADILGRMYEQFLGATVTLEGRRAVVEERPEVRKAGGVYYTPLSGSSSGRFPTSSLAGTTAAIDFIADMASSATDRRTRVLESMRAVEEHEGRLFARMLDGLSAIDEVTLHGAPKRRTPTALFSVAGHSPQETYEHLARLDVNAPASHFYAIEASRWVGLGETGAVRAGLAPYSNDEDVDRLVAGVAELAR